ncbi:unnamed protein product [Heterobilharzia americana]|nr:unnamed protein product [Heterobilharzia americana]
MANHIQNNSNPMRISNSNNHSEITCSQIMNYITTTTSNINGKSNTESVQQFTSPTELEKSSIINEISCDNNENRTNLIVNYLPQTMSQEEMRALFSKIGKLVSCKLIRDKLTGQSLGYGFVNYVDAADAERAIRGLNKMRLQNKTIKVSLARPSCESIKGANLYICGLPKFMTESDWRNYFTHVEKLLPQEFFLIALQVNPKAELAIQQFNGYRVGSMADSPLVVKFANIPTSGKNGTNPMLSSPTNNSSVDYKSQNIPNLSSLLNLNKLAMKANELQSLITPEILNGDSTFDIFHTSTTPNLTADSPGGGKSTRRVGGPVHPSAVHKLRFNPLDGCAIPIRINPFENVNHGSGNSLTSSPATASGLRSISKNSDSNINAAISLAAAIAAATTNQPDHLQTQLLSQLNGAQQRIPGVIGLTVPWMGANMESSLNPLTSIYQTNNSLGDLFSQPNNVLTSISSNTIPFLTRPEYYSGQIGPTTTAQANVNFNANKQQNLNLMAPNFDINVAATKLLQNFSIQVVSPSIGGTTTTGLFPTNTTTTTNLNSSSSPPSTVLKVEGLAPGTDESIIQRLFSAFPSVLSVQLLPTKETTFNGENNTLIMNNNNNERQEMKALVIMSDQEQAKLAVHYLNGCTLQNRVLKVSSGENTNPQINYNFSEFLQPTNPILMQASLFSQKELVNQIH